MARTLASNETSRQTLWQTLMFGNAGLGKVQRVCRKGKRDLREVVKGIRKSSVRLFRTGQYSPLRGTFLELDARRSLLYTRGSIPFYQMYPGMYVPRALEIDSVETETPARTLAQEILALTKMNWNNTQFDSALPITLRAARQVGAILKYAGDQAAITSSYAYYM